MGLLSSIGGFLKTGLKTVGGFLGNNLGSIVSGAGTIYGQQQANQANREISREQMAFQERMSNTAYQRAMNDMRRSGLNPMLAYKQGGSSSPGGAGIPMQNVAAGLPAAISSAVQAKKAPFEIAKMETDAALAKANAAVSQERVNTEKAVQAAQYASAKNSKALAGLNLEKMKTQHALTQQEIVRIETAVAELGIKDSEFTSAQARALRAAIDARITDSGVGETLQWLERLKETINPFELSRLKSMAR